jgi:uncharacterized membrane protein
MRLLPAARRRDEQGIVAVVMALIICFTMIPLAALAVDIGVQRVARRDMQALADVVALDVARQLDGRTYSQLQGNLQAWADKSAARNDGIGETRTVVPELGRIDESRYSTTDGEAIFVPITSDSGGIPTAVRVTASATVGFNLAPGTGGATRTAIAQSRSSACIKIGSYAANLDSKKSALLNHLVGDALNLSAVSYTGLANANISLLGLATELGVATPQELLDLDNLSLNDLYLASAKALSNEGGEIADITLLNQLASASLSGLAHINVSDLIAMENGSGSALATSLNVLDLVAGSAFLANGTSALSVPSVTAGVPNVGAVSASLHIVQAPVMWCGHVGSSRRTSQVTLDLTVTLANLNILGLAAGSTVHVQVDLAEATGTMTKIQCGPGNPDGVEVSVASSLSQLSTGLDVDLKLLGLAVAHVDGDVGTLAAPANQAVAITVPPRAYDEFVSSGSGVVLPQMSSGNLSIQILGGLPPLVSDASILASVYSSIVLPTLNPLTTNLNSDVIGPVSKLLGLQLGGADVALVRKPSCTDVSLVG